MSGNAYMFPALRGIQAGQEYYVAMCPLKQLHKIFLFDENEVPAELRAQRTLNAARIPEICRYILENRRDYAFSAITASIDGKVQFEPADMGGKSSDVGTLVVSMSARFVINDGQHRRAAIERALEESPSLGDETIAVVFYIDANLRRSQQLFADLNKHAVRPTKSLGIFYDYREPLACLARDLARQVPCFKGLVEMEKTTISNRSIKLFTLSGIYQATGALLGIGKNEPISDKDKKQAISYWTELGNIIPEWQMAAKRQVTSAELRQEYIHVHTVTLHAFGTVGNALLQAHPDKWRQKLRRLRKIDWSRSNAQLWEGRAMRGGQMSKASQSIQLTTNLLKKMLGLDLTPGEQKIESLFESSKQYE